MLSELSSLLSAADVTNKMSGGHKFGVNLNKNRIRSISAYSSNSIFYFMTIISDQATPEEVTMTSRFIEKTYASFVIACIGLMPFHRIKADDQASIEEYLSQFHQNMGIRNGNGAAISKAINVASRMSEGATDALVGISEAVIQAVREGVTDEDLKMTQNFLQECWDRSREADTDFINVVNETILSLQDKFSKDAIDPVTRTLQEGYRAVQRELDTWGFLGEADVDMNLWDDVESMSDDELTAALNPYTGETIEFDEDEDLEDEMPELDTMLEDGKTDFQAYWQQVYNEAKQSMSNSQAVAYANQKLGELKAKDATVKEREVRGTSEGNVKVAKSAAEQVDDQVTKDARARRAIENQIVHEGYADENNGGLDRHNQQVKADTKRHQVEEAAAQRTAAANRRTAAEEQKNVINMQKEQRKQAELELKQQQMQAQQESVKDLLKIVQHAGKHTSSKTHPVATSQQALATVRKPTFDKSYESSTGLGKNFLDDLYGKKGTWIQNNDSSEVIEDVDETNEGAGSAMLKAKLDADKAALKQAQEDGASKEKVAEAQATVDEQRVQNQEAQTAQQQEVPEPVNEPLSPIQQLAAEAKERSKAAMAAAKEKEQAQQVQNEASIGEAIESIKYSIQSISAEKINGCKNIGQLNAMEKKLKTLRSRYNAYLNRYKKKAEKETKRGNKILAKFHDITVGDPKAFMLQYGSYIREINARIEMIRRRKKAIAPDIGKPVQENAFATISDMELNTIDYCIEAVDKMASAPDDEVFEVIIPESAEAPMNEADFDWASAAKKGTGAFKDLYDIATDMQDRKNQANSIKYTKNPKTTDKPDRVAYYDNNRQRGGVNVAAAANAKEMTGYQGHKTFDREVFTNMDMKKANEAVPTFAKATIGFIVDETEQVVTRDVLIGVKAWVHKAPSMDLISDIYNAIINKRKFLKFVKWISGEEKSLTDLLFGIKELKLDANATRNPSVGRWTSAFRRRKRLNKMAVPYLMKEYTPNGTIVVTMNEVNFIKSEYGIDIMRGDHVKMLMEQNFLLGFVVLDQADEIVHVIYDGHGDFQTYSYAALARETSEDSRMVRELYRAVAR